MSYLSGDHDTVSLSYSWLSRQEGLPRIGLSTVSSFRMDCDRRSGRRTLVGAHPITVETYSTYVRPTEAPKVRFTVV